MKNKDKFMIQEFIDVSNGLQNHINDMQSRLDDNTTVLDGDCVRTLVNIGKAVSLLRVAVGLLSEETN